MQISHKCNKISLIAETVIGLFVCLRFEIIDIFSPTVELLHFHHQFTQSPPASPYCWHRRGGRLLLLGRDGGDHGQSHYNTSLMGLVALT